MKDRLTAIFNMLKQVETKGDSTVIMADCLRAIADLANSIPDEERSNDEHGVSQ